MSNMNYKGLSSVILSGGILLDIHCPLYQRIRVDKLDQAFRRIFEQHDDLQYLQAADSPSHAFSVLPSR
jgi:hypothetical protein